MSIAAQGHTSCSTPGQGSGLDAEVWAALATVIDPELDEPITDLGFVRSCEISEAGDVEVHLRLPTSFCAPNFAYLMAGDALDALQAVPGIGEVTVELDDHHDSELINRGLAARAGYVGTFGEEAERDLDELRTTFQRKAHVAAMERACSAALADEVSDLENLHLLTLGELPASPHRDRLIARRREVGLPVDGAQRVLLDDEHRPVEPGQVPIRLRFARTVRVSIDGNAHFCRGLLRTRYPDSAADQRPRQVG